MGNAVTKEADGIAFRRKLPLLGKAPLSHRISFFVLSPHSPVPGAESGSIVVEIGIKEISAAYSEHLTDRTTAYPGVDAGLRALRAAGHDLALVTNKPAPHARRLMDHFGWTPLFAAILGGGDTAELKPSPLPLQTAMQRAGHGPETTWMVGDHHTDLEAARRAGVKSIYLASGIGHSGAETPDLSFPDFAAFAAKFLLPA